MLLVLAVMQSMSFRLERTCYG